MLVSNFELLKLSLEIFESYYQRNMYFIKTQSLSIMFSVNSLYLVYINVPPVTTLPVIRGLSLQRCCSGSRPSESRPLLLTGSHLALEDDVIIANSLKIHAMEVKVDAERLRNSYALQRIQSLIMRKMLDNNTVNGFPVSRVLDQNTEFLDQLLFDYERVASAIEFVDTIRRAEEASGFSPNYFNETRTLEQKMFGVFRHLCCALERKTNRPDTIIPVVLPVIEVMMNNAERYKRDYTIMKDVMRLFATISHGYNMQLQNMFEDDLLMENQIAES